MNINENIYYINTVAPNVPDGGNKAKSDFKVVFEKMGFKEFDLSIKSKNMFLRNICKAILPLKLLLKGCYLQENDIVFVQIPTYTLNIFTSVLFFLKKVIKFKLVIIIHDIEKLRRVYKFSSSFYKNEGKYFEVSDAIICHNKKMKSYLIESGIKEDKIFVLGIFDYILSSKKKINMTSPDKKNEINIAGNLDVRRSPYIYELLNSNIEGVELNLYGAFYNKDLVSSNENSYKGCYPSNEIPYILKGGWGLVWDGESINDCIGNIGKYLVYINQHKVSLYIAAGLPVIIWENAGLAEFVKENQIGILVSSLTILKEKIEQVSDESYMEMVEHVMQIRGKLLDGGYAESAIRQVLIWIRGLG